VAGHVITRTSNWRSTWHATRLTAGPMPPSRTTSQRSKTCSTSAVKRCSRDCSCRQNCCPGWCAPATHQSRSA